MDTRNLPPLLGRWTEQVLDGARIRTQRGAATATLSLHGVDSGGSPAQKRKRACATALVGAQVSGATCRSARETGGSHEAKTATQPPSTEDSAGLRSATRRPSREVDKRAIKEPATAPMGTGIGSQAGSRQRQAPREYSAPSPRYPPKPATAHRHRRHPPPPRRHFGRGPRKTVTPGAAP